MDVENTDLTTEELDFLIEKLTRESDEASVLDADSESLNQTEIQADLKVRLQRGIDDLKANDENVPEDLLRLLKSL